MEITLKSGAVLLVNPSSFRQANALKKTLLPYLKGVSFDNVSADITTLLSPLIDTLTSYEVEEALFACFAECAYYPRGKGAGEVRKVDLALFDDPQLRVQARKDYHEICLYVIRENVECFFDSILSWLKSKDILKSSPFPPLTSTLTTPTI
jgi:hypothetical protein